MLKEILWLVLHNADVESASQSSSTERAAFIEYCVPGQDSGVTCARKMPPPRILKTHLPVHLLPAQGKLITIFRNPKDALVSYYHFYKSATCFGKFTGSWSEFFEMAMVDNLCYGNIFDHMIALWQRRHETNVLILFFEDVVRHPESEIRKVANFVKKSLSSSDIEKIVEATTFEAMRMNPMTNASTIPDEVDASISPFMRKGTIGDWKNHFTVNQSRRFDEMIEKKMKGTDIVFTYDL